MFFILANTIFKYDIYGEILSTEGKTDNRFLYNGKYGVQTAEILRMYDIDINSPANGVMLPTKGFTELGNPTVHRGSHSNKGYFNLVNQTLYRAHVQGGTKEDIVDALHLIRISLLRGEIKLNSK